jgi:hypothetical protein
MPLPMLARQQMGSFRTSTTSPRFFSHISSLRAAPVPASNRAPVASHRPISNDLQTTEAFRPDPVAERSAPAPGINRNLQARVITGTSPLVPACYFCLVLHRTHLLPPFLFDRSSSSSSDRCASNDGTLVFSLIFTSGFCYAASTCLFIKITFIHFQPSAKSAERKTQQRIIFDMLVLEFRPRRCTQIIAPVKQFSRIRVNSA